MTTKEVLADEMCNMAMRPLSTQECILQPCDGLEWIASTWTPVCDLIRKFVFNDFVILVFFCNVVFKMLC